MAHNIATINGKNSIAYVGETPWHRLGTSVPAGISLTDAISAASLDWDVKALPTFADIEVNGLTTRTKLDVQAIIRETDGTVLGTVGPRYTPIQHREAFKVFEPAIAAGQLRVAVLGSLGKGETVWLLLKLAEDAQAVRILKDGRPDLVLPYVKATLAHDGSRNFQIAPTGVRVVCANTLSQSDNEGVSNWVSIRHTASATEAIKQVGTVLEGAAEKYRASIEIFRKLAATTVTEAELEAYIHAVLPLPAKPRDLVKVAQAEAAQLADALLASADIVSTTVLPETLVDEKVKTLELRYATQVANVENDRATAIKLATEGLGNDGSSLWDGYNGLTELVDHTSRRDTEHAKERAAYSAIAGDGLAIKNRALEVARELVAA